MMSSSSLLDELPCLLGEGDKLTSRLLFHMTLLSPTSVTSFGGMPQENGALLSAQSADADVANNNVFMLQQRIASVNMDALAKIFARYSLAPQFNDVEKLGAVLPLDPVVRKAVETLVAKLHQLMRRIHQWQQALWDLLTQFLAHTSPSISFTTHRALTSLVLDALVKFVKMHLLWTSYSSIPGLLTLHTFLQQEKTITSGSSEDCALDNREDRFLREFVLCFGTNPLFKIQQTLQMHSAAPEIALNLSALVLSCFESFMRCQNLQQLRDQGVFDLERCFQGQLQDSALLILEDLVQRQRQAEWAICVALCIPSQLHRDAIGSISSGLRLWDFTHLAAQDRLMMRIARDRMVNVHDLLYQQITYSLSQQVHQPQNSAVSVGAMMAGSNSVSPSKKAMSALSKQTLQCCGATHNLQREMVRWMLHSCNALLAQNAALVAPLLPLILAVGELVRSEAEWLLCHAQAAQCNLPQHVKAKHWHRAQTTYAFDAIGFSGLLSGLQRLRTQIMAHAHFVHEYYHDYLANGIADAIVYTIRQFKSTLHVNKTSRNLEIAGNAVSPSNLPSESQIMEMLENFAIKERYTLDDSASPPTSRMAWRREWEQISLFFLTSDVRLPSQLTGLMERATTYTQYSQHLGQLVDLRLNVSTCLCWFPIHVEHAFTESLRTGNFDHVFALLVLVIDLVESRNGLSEQEDAREADLIIGNLRKLNERMQSAIARHWERCMRIVVQYDILAARQSAMCKPRDSAAKHQSTSIVPSRDKSDSTRPPVNALKPRSASLSNKPMIRGQRLPISPKSQSTESKKQLHHRQCGPVGPQIQAQATINALAAAIDHHIRNRRPDTLLAVVQQHIQRSLRQLLREFIATTTPHYADAGVAMAAFKLRSDWSDACIELRSFLRCAQRLFPNVIELQQTLAIERSCAETRLPASGNAPSIDSLTFADRVAWFYLQTLERCCGGSSTSSCWIASVRKQRFVAAAAACNTENAPFDLVNKAALRQLLGAAGLRSVAMRIMQDLVVQVNAVRTALALDSSPLQSLEALLSQSSSETLSAAAIKQLGHLEPFVRYAIQIGSTVFLLQQLDDDQNQAWEATLREMLQEGERKDTTSECPWQLLPVAFAASFHSSVWKRTSYVNNLDAANTNMHMITLAVVMLLKVFDPPASSRQDEGATCHTGIASLVQRLNAQGAQMALAMRQWDKSLPSPAMLSTARLVATASRGRCWLPLAHMLMTDSPCDHHWGKVMNLKLVTS